VGRLFNVFAFLTANARAEATITLKTFEESLAGQLTPILHLTVPAQLDVEVLQGVGLHVSAMTSTINIF
jgi:hypothetical protein